MTPSAAGRKQVGISPTVRIDSSDWRRLQQPPNCLGQFVDIDVVGAELANHFLLNEDLVASALDGAVLHNKALTLRSNISLKGRL
jgi:hypothetical protein